jgi:glyceraldehyde-3-phosphate dehydrogenase/erythrose-4-phosphate dehydrogenase
MQVSRKTTREEVNALLKAASESAPLKGIMGFEERPLVSTDYVNDNRYVYVYLRYTVSLCEDTDIHAHMYSGLQLSMLSVPWLWREPWSKSTHG